jgi:hypothetical protein
MYQASREVEQLKFIDDFFCKAPMAAAFISPYPQQLIKYLFFLSRAYNNPIN